MNNNIIGVTIFAFILFIVFGLYHILYLIGINVQHYLSYNEWGAITISIIILILYGYDLIRLITIGKLESPFIRNRLNIKKYLFKASNLRDY